MAGRHTQRQAKAERIANFVTAVSECIDDHVFDQKRWFLKQLTTFSKLGRGERIREITLRRKQRNLKLIPFLVLSCQKLLIRRSQSLLESGFERILLSSIEGPMRKIANYHIEESQAQSCYQIAEGDLLTPSELDVSKNLVANFEQESFSTNPITGGQAIKNTTTAKGLKRDRSLSKSASSKHHQSKVAMTTRPTNHATSRSPLDRLQPATERDKAHGKVKVRAKTPTNYQSRPSANNSRVAEGLSGVMDNTVTAGSSMIMEGDCNRTETSRILNLSSASELRQKLNLNRLIKGNKLLSLIMGVKMRQQSQFCFAQLKKGYHSRLKRVASTYKRRNFMAVEKKLNAFKSRMVKGAFDKIKKAKRNHVSKELRLLKQVFITDFVEQLMKRKNSQIALAALQEAQYEQQFDSARSDLVFQTLRAGDFCTTGWNFSLSLATTLSKTCGLIKGHKKTKRHFGFALVLLQVLSIKQKSQQTWALSRIKERLNRFRVLELGSLRIHRAVSQTAFKLKLEALTSVRSRAARKKAGDLTYLVDVLAALVKRKGVMPTFHYLKLEVPRIDRQNYKLIAVLCQSVAKVMSLRASNLKLECFDRLANATSQLQSTCNRVTDTCAIPSSKPKPKVKIKATGFEAIARELESVTQERKKAVACLSNQRSKPQIDPASSGRTAAEAAKYRSGAIAKELEQSLRTKTKDRFSPLRSGKSPIRGTIYQQTTSSSRLTKELVVEKENGQNITRPHPKIDKSLQDTLRPDLILHVGTKKVIPDAEKHDEIDQAQPDRADEIKQKLFPSKSATLAESKSRGKLTVLDKLDPNLSGGEKAGLKEDFFSFQKVIHEENPKNSPCFLAKNSAPIITQFLADSTHPKAGNGRKCVTSSFMPSQDTEVSCLEEIPNKVTSIPRTHIGPIMKAPRQSPDSMMGKNDHSHVSNYLRLGTSNSSRYGVEEGNPLHLQKNHSSNLVRPDQQSLATQWRELDSIGPADELDDCDVISQLTIVPIQPDW